MILYCEVCDTPKHDRDMKDHDICWSCFYSTERRKDEIEKDKETMNSASKAGEVRESTPPILARQLKLF